jgi:hypothetical protein
VRFTLWEAQFTLWFTLFGRERQSLDRLCHSHARLRQTPPPPLIAPPPAPPTRNLSLPSAHYLLLVSCFSFVLNYYTNHVCLKITHTLYLLPGLPPHRNLDRSRPILGRSRRSGVRSKAGTCSFQDHVLPRRSTDFSFHLSHLIQPGGCPGLNRFVLAQYSGDFGVRRCVRKLTLVAFRRWLRFIDRPSFRLKRSCSRRPLLTIRQVWIIGSFLPNIWAILVFEGAFES